MSITVIIQRPTTSLRKLNVAFDLGHVVEKSTVREPKVCV